MWIHLFEASLTGAALFAIPLMLVVALAGALTVFDRLFRKRQPEVSRRWTSYGGRRV
jgi:uncharacterized iron-regulated membrane protein